MRKRGTRPATITASYEMTDAQVSALETFCESTILGTARFGWPHPRTGSTVEARIVPSSDGSLYSLSCIAADHWVVSLTFEVLP